MDMIPAPIYPATLLFIRHASTDLAGTFCGSSDPRLSPTGQAQLPPLTERLSQETIDAIATSPLLRAVETAHPLAGSRGLTPILRPNLRELAFGEWEGLAWDQIEQRDPRFAARWVAEFPALPAPGGEPIELFKQRVRDEISWLRHYPAASLAVFTHAGVLRLLLEEHGHVSSHHAWERTRDYTTIIRCTQKTPDGMLNVQV